MLAPLLTLDQALARGEILAANTTESVRVIRVGDPCVSVDPFPRIRVHPCH